jgi:hypothetical protein
VKALVEFVTGVVLRRLLGPPDGRRRGARAVVQAPRRGRGRATAKATATGARRRPAAAPPTQPLGRPRGFLVGLMLGSLGLGAVLMFFFEHWYTRLPAVLLLFTFVVSGVFVITGSGMLDDDEDVG